MNFHAVNETPIAGWATLYGQGQAGMSLAATGESANVVLGAGKAALSLKAEGGGIRLAMAYGEATQVLEAAGEGVRAATGEGLASMALEAEGDGQVTQVVGGRAVMRFIVPVARPGVLEHGSGQASLSLQADGDARIAKAHYGAAHPIMVLESPAHGRGVTPKRGQATVQTWINAVPYGRLVAQHSGIATMSLEARADARTTKRVYGAGRVTMRLEPTRRQQSRQYREIRGEAAATMRLALDTRDLRIAILPTEYEPAPKSRSMRVSPENRTMRVPASSRVTEMEVA